MPTLLATRLIDSEEIIQEFFDVITPLELQLHGQASATIKRDGITITTLTPQNRTYKLFTIGTYEINLFGKCLSGEVWSYNVAVSGGGGSAGSDTEFNTLCDDTLGDQSVMVTFLRRYTVDEFGGLTSEDTGLDGVTPYVTLGTVGLCASDAIATASDDSEFIILSDDTLNDQTVVVPFLRQYVVDQVGAVTYTDTTLDGVTSYTVLGTVGVNPPVAETSSATATPNFINSSVAGSTTAGLQKFSVSNVGDAAGVLIGDPLPVGASVTFEGYYDEATDTYVRLNSAAYDGTGTVLLIAETA